MYLVLSYLSGVLRATVARHQITGMKTGHFEDESFQPINCTGTNDQTHNKENDTKTKSKTKPHTIVRKYMQTHRKTYTSSPQFTCKN